MMCAGLANLVSSGVQPSPSLFHSPCTLVGGWTHSRLIWYNLLKGGERLRQQGTNVEMALNMRSRVK